METVVAAGPRILKDGLVNRQYSSAFRDPALFGRTVLQLAQGWATHPGEVGRAASSFATVSARIGAAATGRALRALAGGDTTAADEQCAPPARAAPLIAAGLPSPPRPPRLHGPVP